MRNIADTFQKMSGEVPAEIRQEIDYSFAISEKIYNLMCKKGLNKKQFAEALGKKPSEITKWLSGQHNFTIRTIAMLSIFFNEPIIEVCTQKTYGIEDEIPSIAAENSNI